MLASLTACAPPHVTIEQCIAHELLQYPDWNAQTQEAMRDLVAESCTDELARLGQDEFDKRMRTTTDAFEFLGIPVIGIMPSPNMNRRLKGQMAMIQDRVVSGRRLPAPDKGQA